MLSVSGAVPLKQMHWDTVGVDVYLPSWRREPGTYAEQLAGRRVSDLPELVRDPRSISDRVTSPRGMIWSNAKRDEYARRLLGRALTVALIEYSWTAHFEPLGHSVAKDDLRMTPGEVIEDFKSGRLSAQECAELCNGYGIGELTLVPATRVSELEQVEAQGQVA